MKKTVKRCYGKKPVVKEKSFIRDFFDGDKSSDASLFDTCSDGIPQDDFYGEDKHKDNITSSHLDSPVLFQYSSSEDFTNEKPLIQKNLMIKKNTEVDYAPKTFKTKKLNRQFRKKPKQIQHLSTKFCKSAQPRWSDFYKHKFTIEKSEKCPVFYKNKYENNIHKEKTFKSKSAKRSALRDINERNVQCISDAQTFDSNFTTQKKKKVSLHNSLYSSGELFLESCQKENNVKEKKNRGNEECIYNQKQKCNVEFVSTEQGNKNRITNPKENKRNSKKQNAEPWKENKEFASSQSSFTSQIFSSSNDTSENISRQIVEKGECSIIIPRGLLTQNDLLNKRSRNKSLPYEVNNDCGFSKSTNFTTPKIKQNVNFRPRSCEQSELPHSLLMDNSFSNKEVNINEQESDLNVVQNIKHKTYSPSSNAVLKCSKHTQFETHYSFVADFARERSNTSKKICNVDKTLNLKGFTSDLSNDFQCSNFLKKRIGKFVTSTPVVQSKKKIDKNSKNLNLSSLDGSKKVTSISLNSFTVSDLHYENKTEVHNSMLYSSLNENFHNLCLDSLLFDNKKSLQCDKNLVAVSKRKPSSVPNKTSAISELSKRNRSLLSISKDIISPPQLSEDYFKNELLKLCSQEMVEPFAGIYDWNNLKIKKIGEGSFGEVFMITGHSSSVLKIIPVSVNSGDKLQEFQSILSEVQISKCLSELRTNKTNKTKNYVKVKRSSLVYGSYPSQLISAWDNYHRTNDSSNDRPSGFPDNQIFAILELEHGGRDMCAFVLKNAKEAECILHQIIVSLAIAEEEFYFEHRDLHLGNILVKRCNQKKISYKLQGKDISLSTYGLHVALIDFTFSRLHKDDFVYFNDLAEDESLFDQTGDYQFEIYKKMKIHLGNQWYEGSLFSNVLWLKYLCQKLLEANYSRPSSMIHQKGLQGIEAIDSTLTDCNSALECLEKCKITKHHFRKVALDSNLTKKSILVSRNSSQKSKLL